MHLEVHRASDGGDEYVCHLCPKKFKAKGYLQKHLERHENKRRKRKKRREEAAAAAAAAAAGLEPNSEGVKEMLINSNAMNDEDDEDDIDDHDDSMGDGNFRFVLFCFLIMHKSSLKFVLKKNKNNSIELV